MSSFEEAIENNRTYEYTINLDERGEFYASVQTAYERIVFEIRGLDIFEDGFMKHKNDLIGLLEYLKDLGFITANGKLVAG